METLKFSRRSFLLSSLALAGCETTGMMSNTDKVLTSAYDGRYEISVLRTWEYTAWTVDSGNWARYKNKPEELARLDVSVVGGNFVVHNIHDKSVGPNYANFRGQFYDDGSLYLTMVAGYEVGLRSPKKISVRGQAGTALAAQGTITFDAGKFDDNHRALVKITKK